MMFKKGRHIGLKKGQTHRFARTALMVANGAVVCGRILVELENIKMRFWKAQLPRMDGLVEQLLPISGLYNEKDSMEQ
jgi:hypothetical protein